MAGIDGGDVVLLVATAGAPSTRKSNAEPPPITTGRP